MRSQTLALFPRLYRGDFAQLRNDWESWLTGNALTAVFTPNPEQVVQMEESVSFAKEMLQAQVHLPDGIGMVFAHSLLFHSSLQRLAGVEVVEWWLREGAAGKTRTLLIGGQEGVAKKVADRFDLTGEWCSAVSGYQDISNSSPAEEKALTELIVTWKPKVIFVAFGAPHQERWILEHRSFLEKNGVRVAMVCGGSLDFLSEKVARAPQWLRDTGLEWAYRLVQEPWRWRRQVKLITFLGFIAEELVRQNLKKFQSS